MAKRGISMLMKLVTVLSLALGGLCDYNGGQFRAFYLVQQWLGSYCNQRGTRCCYPDKKPSPDFTIYGLWPYYSDGSFPYNCPAGASYDVAPYKPIQSKLEKSWPTFTCPLIGRKFWVHEWNKHGTCSKSVLGEMAYINAALNLKNKANIYQALARAGIRPSRTKFYSLKSIKQAIVRATGFHPWVNCNSNAQGNSQIWQVTLCADRTGTRLIKCPYIPKGRDGCDNKIQLPPYY